ncbi:hypothetical protein NE237_016557 [Protea cynaroides]|uniref:Uncharacterized protein n=1 Tax=Protea cynaroides TaxID=273540 RepID=A0A9Q0HE95_9MAGN|nr:hypothetical protein NE237_016557 [Protea cynaroides]
MDLDKLNPCFFSDSATSPKVIDLWKCIQMLSKSPQLKQLSQRFSWIYGKSFSASQNGTRFLRFILFEGFGSFSSETYKCGVSTGWFGSFMVYCFHLTIKKQRS